MRHPTSESPFRTLHALLTPKRCLAIALIFFMLMIGIGAIPGKATALSTVIYDKLLHFLAYAFISCMVFGGIAGSLANRAWRTLLAVAALGALDEAIQWLLPYRHANLTDWEVNMLAAAFCVGLLVLFHPIYAARKQRIDAHRHKG